MRYLHTMVRIRDIDQSLDSIAMGLGSSRFGAPKTKKADLRCIFLAGTRG